MYRTDDDMMMNGNDLPQMPQLQNAPRGYTNSYMSNNTNVTAHNNNNNDRQGLVNGPFGNHYGIDSQAGSIAGTNTVVGNLHDLDKHSMSSTPSKMSKFTYSEYPQIRPTNPLYQSTNTIKTATSHVSRASRTSKASTMNTVSRRQKYNPNAPRRIYDWRWASALAALIFFPTGLIALGLAIKSQTKFNDGFIDESKKLNHRAFVICVISFILGLAWILTMFFLVDPWPRTNG